MSSRFGEYKIENAEDYMGTSSAVVLGQILRGDSYELYNRQYGQDDSANLNDVVSQMLNSSDRREVLVNLPRLITGLFKTTDSMVMLHKADYISTVKFCKELFMTAVHGSTIQFADHFRNNQQMIEAILKGNPLVKKVDNLSLECTMPILEKLESFENSYGLIQPEDIVITLANGANLSGLVMTTQRKFNWLPARFSRHKEHDICPVLYNGALVDIFEHMMINPQARIIVWDEDTTEAAGLIRTKKYLKQCIGMYCPIFIYTNSGTSVSTQKIVEENQYEVL